MNSGEALPRSRCVGNLHEEGLMIKSISLLTRRAELSHDEFVRHWVMGWTPPDGIDVPR